MTTNDFILAILLGAAIGVALHLSDKLKREKKPRGHKCDYETFTLVKHSVDKTTNGVPHSTIVFSCPVCQKETVATCVGADWMVDGRLVYDISLQHWLRVQRKLILIQDGGGS